MWNKNKIDPNDTVNMCNQFLIVHLIKKMKMSEARGGSQYTNVYRKAISSIKKYPLPIICKAQLQSIHGIGESLSEQLQKLIKKHYSAYLNSSLQQRFPKQQQKASVFSQHSNSLMSIQKSQGKKIGNLQKDQQDSKSAKSSGVQYKPRINTANAYFLQVLKKLKDKNKVNLIPSIQVKRQVQQKYTTAKNKSWSNIESNLHTSGYIVIEKRIDQNQLETIYYILTQKGEKYAQSLEQKTKANDTKHKVLNEVKKFKTEINEKQETNRSGLSQDPENQDISKFKYPPKYLKPTGKQLQFNQSLFQLVIDIREKKQKFSDINFFAEKISKKFNIQCRTASLTLGDFIWVYDNKVLDYIVERKKADDLASSIIDGRYKDQKYRLKNSGISNIFYLYQGHPSDSCNASEKQLKNALLKTLVKQKFHVYKTNDVNESMRFLYDMHQQIYKQVLRKKAKYLCSLDEFIEQNAVHRNLTVEKIFALGLMTIPGVGKTAINKLLHYYKSYRSMHDHLKIKFDNNEERINFLKELFKGSGMLTSLPKVLVNLLFSQNYMGEEKQNYYSQLEDTQFYIQERSLYPLRPKAFSIIRQQHECYEEEQNN